MIDINELKRQITEALRAGIPVIARYTKLHTEPTGRIQIGTARVGSAIVQEDVSFLGESSPTERPFVAIDSDPECTYLDMVMEPVIAGIRIYGSGRIDDMRSYRIAKVIVTRDAVLAAVAEEQTIMAILHRIAELK